MVLGSNGFLGQYLTAELKCRSVEVTGYDRTNPAGDAPDHFVRGDFALETPWHS
jgi:nucleoside-diphosphate-sugar epimerase